MALENSKMTVTAGEDLKARRRVKIKPETTSEPVEVVYADIDEACIGVTEYGFKNGQKGAIRLIRDAGAFDVECLVDSAIVRGTPLFGAAKGMLSDAGSGVAQAVSLDVGVDNAFIEVLFTQ